MNAAGLVGKLLSPGHLRFGDPQTAGALTLIPVRHDGEQARYHTYAVAAAAGLVRVEEVGGGSVNDLVVANRGDQAVLFVEGEVLAGLKQTRTLNATMLVPAGATVTIPVTCVEQGRWGAPAPVARDEFHISPRMRHTKNRAVQASMRHGTGARSDQGELWREVDRHLLEHQAPSPSRSYHDLHRRRGADIRRLLADLRPDPGQQGILALVGSRPVVLDLFDRAETMAALREALVGSYAADALVATGAAGESEVEAAIEWVHDLASAPATVHPGIGAGEVVQTTSGHGIVSALVSGGVVIHLAALHRKPAAAPETRITRPARRGSWFGVGR